MQSPVSLLILGPSGSGKSHLADSALLALGSGIVVMAPGLDEMNSYIDIEDNSNYEFKGFDDPGFLPSIGKKEATGHTNLLRYLSDTFTRLQATEESKRPKVLVLDTVSAMGNLAYNATLAKYNIEQSPLAMSKEGAAFYQTLRMKQDEVMRLARAIKGLGVHLIALGHIVEKENISEASSAVHSSKQLVAAVPGGFRDSLPSYFDLVFHSQVSLKDLKPVHYLQYRPSPKRPTKGRFHIAADKPSLIPNTWEAIMSLIGA